MILFFRRHRWTDGTNRCIRCPVFVLAGIFSAALLFALLFVGPFVDRDRSSSKH